MLTEITKSDILKMNPHISPSQLEMHRIMLAKLRGCGLRRTGYRIAMPYAGRRVYVQEDNESRIIRLRQSSDRV